MIKNINSSTYFFLFFFEQVREKKRKKERKKVQFPREYPTIIEVHLGIIKQVYHKSNSQVYSILFWKSFHQELIWRASWRVPDQMQVIPTNFSSIYLMFAKRHNTDKYKKSHLLQRTTRLTPLPRSPKSPVIRVATPESQYFHVWEKIKMKT